MDTRSIIVVLLIGLIVFSGCIQTQNSENVTCNSPYIKSGNGCCLDKNENNMCDGDPEDPICSDKNGNNICDGDESSEIEADEEKFKISEALDFCLKEYVYGKEGSWVDLANEHCGPLLPDRSYCMYEYSKGGTFGVLCTTSSISKELDECIKENAYGCTTDSDCINKSNTYCWGYLDGDCEFDSIGVSCLID